MDPILIGVATVSAGFALNRILPDVFSQIKSVIDNFCYKTTVITLSQSKFILINMVKFLNEFSQFKNYRSVIIVIDKVVYEIPIVAVLIPFNDYYITVKCCVDYNNNITHIILSTWKLYGFWLDSRRIDNLNNFINKFPFDETPFSPKDLMNQIKKGYGVTLLIPMDEIIKKEN